MSLRAAVPSAQFVLHSRQLQRLRAPPFLALSRRQLSTDKPTPPKPRVLEKPDKFRPPSHPSRLKSKTRYTYGPDLTPAQKTRRYPHMMPPEGSFMHWFLTNRTIHVWISLGILSSLVIGIWFTDFVNTTPYLDMLPPNSMFFSHPLSFLARWFEVYNLHVAYVTAQTAEKRKQNVDDVRKRADYRKAHGLEQGEGIFGGWTAKSDEETMGPALKENNVQVASTSTSTSAPAPEPALEPAQGTSGNVAGQAVGGADTYVDFEGKQRPVKKWFGIW